MLLHQPAIECKESYKDNKLNYPAGIAGVKAIAVPINLDNKRLLQ